MGLLTLLFSCGGGKHGEEQHLEGRAGFALVPGVKQGEALATFSGGCFWAMQECMVELKGVNKVVSGYAGGKTVNPTYEEVTTRKTGHAESVLVYYNPAVISFERLTAAFFHAHDPTQVDGQGPDLGSDYRSIAFYRSEEERDIIETLISQTNKANNYTKPVATEVVPFTKFYPAESYHQDYYKQHNWEPYIRNVSKPKVLKLRKAMPDLIKSEYLD